MSFNIRQVIYNIPTTEILNVKVEMKKTSDTEWNELGLYPILPDGSNIGTLDIALNHYKESETERFEPYVIEETNYNFRITLFEEVHTKTIEVPLIPFSGSATFPIDPLTPTFPIGPSITIPGGTFIPILPGGGDLDILPGVTPLPGHEGLLPVDSPTMGAFFMGSSIGVEGSFTDSLMYSPSSTIGLSFMPLGTLTHDVTLFTFGTESYGLRISLDEGKIKYQNYDKNISIVGNYIVEKNERYYVFMKKNPQSTTIELYSDGSIVDSIRTAQGDEYVPNGFPIVLMIDSENIGYNYLYNSSGINSDDINSIVSFVKADINYVQNNVTIDSTKDYVYFPDNTIKLYQNINVENGNYQIVVNQIKIGEVNLSYEKAENYTITFIPEYTRNHFFSTVERILANSNETIFDEQMKYVSKEVYDYGEYITEIQKDLGCNYKFYNLFGNGNYIGVEVDEENRCYAIFKKGEQIERYFFQVSSTNGLFNISYSTEMQQVEITVNGTTITRPWYYDFKEYSRIIMERGIANNDRKVYIKSFGFIEGEITALESDILVNETIYNINVN